MKWDETWRSELESRENRRLKIEEEMWEDTQGENMEDETNTRSTDSGNNSRDSDLFRNENINRSDEFGWWLLSTIHTLDPASWPNAQYILHKYAAIKKQPEPKSENP